MDRIRSMVMKVEICFVCAKRFSLLGRMKRGVGRRDSEGYTDEIFMFLFMVNIVLV